jgi:hypothetical protein
MAHTVRQLGYHSIVRPETMTKARYALYLVVLVIPVVHTFVAPYTKVEESFTLHAARDVLQHGVWNSHAIDQVGLTMGQ